MRLMIFNTVCGICGVIITFLFGGWSQLLTLFLIAIVIDYLSGVAASLMEGRGLNSAIGFWGLARKAFMLLVITLAHHMDIAFGMNVIMNGVITFYLANELISMIENYGRLGLPMPPRLRQLIETLKQSGSDKSL